MTRRTALLDQPGLWDEPEQTPTLPQPEKVQPPRTRNHVLGLPRPWPKHQPCTAICLTCGRPEDLGVCPHGCAIVCNRPTHTGPVEICITTTRADAHIVISPATAYMKLRVHQCPHCDHNHAHAPEDHPYRTAPCGKPYILNIKEPQP